MKKTYQKPEIEMVRIAPQNMIATSPGGNDEIGDGTQLVKEHSGSHNDVWDDDWSE